EGGKGKGERGRGKVSNTSFTPQPLSFSQTTTEVHTAYPNRIARTRPSFASTEKLSYPNSINAYFKKYNVMLKLLTGQEPMETRIWQKADLFNIPTELTK
ncbi:hypothetical protein VF02_23165, partial [Nostoc linckia z1]